MSQIYKSGSGGGGGTGILTVTGNDGIVVGATADNIFTVGGSLSVNNNNGITTTGNAGTSTETFNLTNRISNAVTTTDATPTTLATFALGSTAAVFSFDIQVVSFNMTDINGDAYSIFGAARTNGTTAVPCGLPDKIVNEEVEDAADATLFIDQSGNNAIIQVTGLAGKTFHWRTVATYVQVI